MRWTNYHSHTHYCDGKGEAELYVKSAIKNNLYAYGFSGHSPVPFESGWNMKYEQLAAYIKEIKHLKEKYKDEIKIFLGMEVDYVKNLCGVKQYKHLGLDYTIGGVHFLGQFKNGRFWDFDGGKPWFEKGLNELFDGDIKKLVAYYYQQLVDMAVNEGPDVIAHFDLIKKYNKGSYFFDENESWYREMAFESLEKVAKTNAIVEINTRGVLKKLNEEFYPSNFILEKCEELNIPVCLSADTHHPNDVKALLPEALDLVKSIGYKEVLFLDENGWVGQGI
jgi:histidinol-phosphatase (PHP family)